MSLGRIALIVWLAAVPVAARVLPPGIRPFRTYGIEAGLGNLAAMRLAQDPAGFLWVATQDGMYRYDGNRFTRFGLGEGLPSSYVSNVQAAPDGSVWAMTYGGAARFDGRRFVAVAAPQPVNAMSIDDANNVWLATGAGVVRGNAKQPFAPIAGWPREEATAVWYDKSAHALWAASVSRVGRFAGVWTFWPNAGNERTDAIVVDRQRTVWTRSAAHLLAKGESESAFHDESRALPATSTSGYLAIDRRGNLWVPTDRGVATHDDSGWHVVGASEGLPTEWARDVLEDREGSIWIASLGVHRMLGRGELTTYDRRSGLPNAVTWCFAWDRNGRLLVGTDLGLARSTATGWEIIAGTADHQVRSVVEEAGGTLWMGGGPAEVLRAGTKGDVRKYAVPGRIVMKIVRGLDGALWVATRGGGLLRKAANDDRFSSVNVPNGTPDETFRWLTIDSRGRLWAAGEHGIACLDRGTWRRYTKRDGLADNHTAYIAESASGELWATYFEPLAIDGKGAMHIVDRLDARRGLSASKVFLIGEDAHRRLWVGTGAGVDLVNGPLIEHLRSADGLAGDDVDAMAFLAQPVVHSANVTSATSSGFSHYIPRADAPRVEPPPVRITSSAIGAKHDFSATFAALTYLKQDLIEYQVRLLGLEDEWRPAASRDVRYAMLAPLPLRNAGAAAARPVERCRGDRFHHRSIVVADLVGASAGVAGDRGAHRPRSPRARCAAAPPQSRARGNRCATHARTGRRQYAPARPQRHRRTDRHEEPALSRFVHARVHGRRAAPP